MQDRRIETRERFLNAALRCFSEQGYAATSVDDICQAAGKSKGAFFYNFPTKQAVFLALLDQWLETIDSMMAASRSSAQTIPEALRQMSQAMTSVFDQAGGQLPMFLEFWTHASHDPQVWQSLILPFQRYQEYFRQIIEEGIAEGSLRSVNPDVASRALVSLALGLLLQGTLDPDGAQWGEVTSQAIQIYLSGVEKENS